MFAKGTENRKKKIQPSDGRGEAMGGGGLLEKGLATEFGKSREYAYQKYRERTVDVDRGGGKKKGGDQKEVLPERKRLCGS